MVKNKIYSKAEIAEKFHDGMKLMAGIFACRGCADRLVDIIVEKGCKNLEVIANDAGDPGIALGKLYDAHLVSKAHHSHIGMNPYVTELINQGLLTVNLYPQGTLVEKNSCRRCGIRRRADENRVRNGRTGRARGHGSGRTKIYF